MAKQTTPKLMTFAEFVLDRLDEYHAAEGSISADDVLKTLEAEAQRFVNGTKC